MGSSIDPVLETTYKMESSIKQVDQEPKPCVHDDALISNIKERMDTVFPHCICRVDENFVGENRKAYHPEFISIGPLHHGRAELQRMEVHKWRYLHALLNRSVSGKQKIEINDTEDLKLMLLVDQAKFEVPNSETRLAKCVKELRKCERKARNCYEETIKLDSDKFVTMMLVDGCFIIELFLKYSVRSLRKRGDPIFTVDGPLRTLRTDMALLENQFPLFVLQRLFEIVNIPEICSRPLNDLAFQFFKIIIPGHRKAIREKFNQEGNHLLDLIHNCFLPTFSEPLAAAATRKKHRKQKIQRRQTDQPAAREKLKSASKLHESGIALKKADNSAVLDIKFDNGVLHIPEVKIHHHTEALLRNLIAGEQCNCDDFEHVTSYVCLLTKLISSSKDEKILRQKNILSSSLEGEGDVRKLFKKLADEVTMKQFYFEELCKQVNEYKKVRRFSLPLPSCV